VVNGSGLSHKNGYDAASCYRDAAAAFVVFDLTRIATFEAAAKWKMDLDQKVRSLK
jgi:hypothetical protein